MARSCPLCQLPSARVFYTGKLVHAAWAETPTTPGHVVLTPRRHVADWFAASPSEQRELTEAITVARDVILEKHSPDGFNIGIRVGVAAGQNGDHLRIDVVPRYRDETMEHVTSEAIAEALRPSLSVDGRGGARQAHAVGGASDVAGARRGGGRATRRGVAASAARDLDHQPTREVVAEAAAGAVEDAQMSQPRVAEVIEHPAARAPAGEQPRRDDDPAWAGQTLSDDAQYYDDDFVDDRLPRKRGRWIVLLLLVLGGGGGYATYWYLNSPYYGKGRADLRIHRKPKGVNAPGSGGGSAATVKPTIGSAAAGAATSASAAGSGSGSVASSGTAAGSGGPAAGSSGAAAGGGSASGTAASGSGSGSGRTRPRLADLPPQDPRYVALITKARKLLAKRKLRAANRLLARALKIKPDGWEALERLAWRDCKAGRMRRAAKRAKAALQGNGKAPYAHLTLGVIAHERGRRSEAREGYRMFLQLCARCREAREIRRSLRSLGK